MFRLRAVFLFLIFRKRNASETDELRAEKQLVLFPPLHIPSSFITSNLNKISPSVPPPGCLDEKKYDCSQCKWTSCIPRDALEGGPHNNWQEPGVGVSTDLNEETSNHELTLALFK